MTTFIAFTGHRPSDLPPGFGYAGFAHILDRWLEANPAADHYEFICGGALGIDSYAAQYAIDHGIDLHLALPFPADVMSKFWKPWDAKRLHDHIDAAMTVTCAAQTFEFAHYQTRNMMMVDGCDILLAFWSGKQQGGTANCIRYARVQQQNRRIRRPLHIENLLPGGQII